MNSDPQFVDERGAAAANQAARIAPIRFDSTTDSSSTNSSEPSTSSTGMTPPPDVASPPLPVSEGNSSLPIAVSLLVQDELSLLSPSELPNSLGRLGEYEISKLVGLGGMGVVFKAWDAKLDRWVAIKTLAPHLVFNPNARRRFVKEARAAASIRHPNVIPIYSVSFDESIPHFVMPFLEGGSLQQALDQDTKFLLPDLLRIGSQSAAGLAAAHRQGVVHRDIKPDNIFQESGSDQIILTDFGLARSVRDESSIQTRGIAGTSHYRSPEQALGESIDPRSDLFSLGSVLYTLCTNKLPFQGANDHDLADQIINHTPTPIQNINPEIPDWFCAVVTKLMAKDKSQRYQSAAEVRQVMEAARQTTPDFGLLDNPEPPAQRVDSPRLPLGMALSVALLITLGGLLTIASSFLVFPVHVGLSGSPPVSNPTPPKQIDASPSLAVSAKPTTPAMDSAPPTATPLTWEKVLGETGQPVPANYPTWPLSLIQALDHARGHKEFTGQLLQANQVIKLQGELKIDGNSSGTLPQPRFMQWDILLTWSDQDSNHVLKLVPIVFFENESVRVLVTASHTVNGIESLSPDSTVFAGEWTPETQTLKLTPQTLPRLDAPFVKPQEHPFAAQRIFDLLIRPDGSVEISDFHLSEQTRFSGRTMVRKDTISTHDSLPRS